MQRGAVVRDSTFMSKEDFYSGTRIELTEAEVKHFHFGTNDVATFVDQIEPTILLYAKNGFRKPADVSRLLNKENKRTACGEGWTPRLTWFLLKFLFHSETAPKPRLARKKAAEPPTKAHILRSLAKQPKKAPLAATESSGNRLPTDEITKRLSSLGRIVRKPAAGYNEPKRKPCTIQWRGRLMVAKKLTRAEARATLSDEQKVIFDQLCDEVIGWSKIYYGVTFVSYVILMELVKSGWSNPTAENSLAPQ